MKRVAVSVVSCLLLTGVAADAFAASIDLDNDVNVVWSDIPCGHNLPQTLCTDPILIFGAPRFVPNARDAGDLLEVAVTFLSVRIPAFPDTLYLNVGDAQLNEVLDPGTGMPLRLSYGFQPTPPGVAASSVVLPLRSFDGFDLLPQGDLFFTVTFNPRLEFTSIDGPLTVRGGQ